MTLTARRRGVIAATASVLVFGGAFALARANAHGSDLSPMPTPVTLPHMRVTIMRPRLPLAVPTLRRRPHPTTPSAPAVTPSNPAPTIPAGPAAPKAAPPSSGGGGPVIVG